MQQARLVMMVVAIAGCGGGGGDDRYTAGAEITISGALTAELVGELEAEVSEQGGETYSEVTIVDDGTFEFFQCGALVSGELMANTTYDAQDYTNLGGWSCLVQQSAGGPTYREDPASGRFLDVLDPPPHLSGGYNVTLVEDTSGATATIEVFFYDGDGGL